MSTTRTQTTPEPGQVLPPHAQSHYYFDPALKQGQQWPSGQIQHTQRCQLHLPIQKVHADVKVAGLSNCVVEPCVWLPPAGAVGQLIPMAIPLGAPRVESGLPPPSAFPEHPVTSTPVHHGPRVGLVTVKGKELEEPTPRGILVKRTAPQLTAQVGGKTT